MYFFAISSEHFTNFENIAQKKSDNLVKGIIINHVKNI